MLDGVGGSVDDDTLQHPLQQLKYPLLLRICAVVRGDAQGTSCLVHRHFSVFRTTFQIRAKKNKRFLELSAVIRTGK